MAGWWRAVGWNCMNSTSATGTPARRAMARPSAVASGGLVVTANSWPAPPVARTVWVARTSAIRPVEDTARTPRHRPPSTRRSRANHCSRTTVALSRVASTSARSTSAPVAAPPAWTTLAIECPPSRARARAPPGCRSNSAPRAISSLTRPGPSSTRTRTASVSHNPAPAANVSARCRSVESSSPPSTAATPPWAQRVADCQSSALVSTPTRSPPAPEPASRTADDSPATPLPSTSTSRGWASLGIRVTSGASDDATPASLKPGSDDRARRPTGPTSHRSPDWLHRHGRSWARSARARLARSRRR